MKTKSTAARLVLLVTAVLLVSISAVAQEVKVKEQDVPKAVRDAFKSAYPQAVIKGYAKEKENGKLFYEIESTDGNTGRDILYNPDGTVAEIEETIAATDLPAAAQELIHTKHPRAVIAKAERTTEKTAQGDKIGYEVSAREGKKRISWEFDADGKLKSKEK
jgi:hypothetical protein